MTRRADFFVSYTESDRPWAEWISWQLEDAGYEVLLQAWDFGVGTHFVHEMHLAATTSARTVAVLSAAYLTSAYGEAEWQVAWAADPSGRGRKLLVVRVENCPQPGLLGQLVGVDLFGSDQQVARQRLLTAAASGRGKPERQPVFPGDHRPDGRLGSPQFPGTSGAFEAVWQPGRSPFPGLAAFDASRAMVFKGRDEDTRLLAAKLSAPAGDSAGLLAVVGPSGCGKSSLVAAGLASKLAQDTDWLVLRPMMPGSRPLAALAEVLAAAGRQRDLGWDAGTLAGRLTEPDEFRETVEKLLAAPTPPARRLLLVVDQAEELLVRTDSADREQFLALLASATAGRVRAISTLRSEYLDRLIESAASTGLQVRAEALNPLSRDLLHLVVAGPAQLAGLTIDDELVARIVDDTGDGQALPLLAYTLQRLYTLAREAGTTVLSASLYETAGGVRGALVDHANAALAEATAATGGDDDQVLSGLLRLITVDADGRPTRRRVSLDEFPDRYRGALTPFVTRRLLAVDSSPGGPATVEVTHERLLTAWSPMASAIGRASDRLRQRTQTESAADDWHRRDRTTDRLWNLVLTTTTLTTVDRHDLSSTARAFLAASLQHGTKARTRRRRLVVASFTGLAVALAAALVATTIATTQYRYAVTQKRQAISRQLVAQADALRNVDPRTALQLNVAADRLHPDAGTRTAIVTALTAGYRAAPLTGPAGVVHSVAFSPNGQTVAAGSDDRTVTLWDVSVPGSHRRLGQPLTGPTDSVSSVAFSPDGQTLAASSYNVVTLWDVSVPGSPRELGRPLTGPGGPVYSVAFSPDGHTLAAASDDRTVTLWNVSDRGSPRKVGPPLTGPGGPVYAVAFSPDGHTLAAASFDRTVTLWDTNDPGSPSRLGQPLTGPAGPVSSVAFSPDGQTLAAASDDRTVTLWDTNDRASPRQLGQPLTGPADSVSSVAFSPDGQTLAAGNYNYNEVTLWNMSVHDAPRRHDQPLTGSGSSVYSLAFSPDGRTVAAGSYNVVTLWDTSVPSTPRKLGQPLDSPNGHITSLVFSPDGRTVAAGSYNVVTLWDTSVPSTPRKLAEPLSGPTGAVSSVAFSPDSQTLAAASVDRTVTLWDTNDRDNPHKLAQPLTGPTGPI